MFIFEHKGLEAASSLLMHTRARGAQLLAVLLCDAANNYFADWKPNVLHRAIGRSLGAAAALCCLLLQLVLV